MINKVFNKWKVIGPAEDKISRDCKFQAVRCQCECGEIRDVNKNNLINGKTKSCGHERKRNYAGLRFGRLTVKCATESQTTKNGEKLGAWLCVCDCGEERVVLTRHLTKMIVTACKKCSKERVKGNLKEKFERTWIDDGFVYNKSTNADLTNQVFGWLTVIEKTEKPKDAPENDRSIWWKCQCVCKEYVNVRTSNLTNKITTSCGCKKRKKLDGEKFNSLTVIEDSGRRNKSRKVIWKCRCDCGNICYVPTDHLTLGVQYSCGCLNSKGEAKIIELLIKMNEKFNTQHAFDSCISPYSTRKLRFDFYLEKYNLLIEYDGEQHFKFSGGWYDHENYRLEKMRDDSKDNWCVQNKIPLLRIPYTDFDNLDEDFLKNAIACTLRNAENGQLVTCLNQTLYDNRQQVKDDVA